MINTIKKRIYSLERFPQKIAMVSDEPWHRLKIRKMVVQKFIVYFWVDDTSYTVFVMAVVYARRNQETVRSKILKFHK